MKKLIIASTNQGKITEIQQTIEYMGIHNIDVLALNDPRLSHSNIPEPDEPFDTFKDNAIHKAHYYGVILNQLTLSDDSGLCIEALDGFPGVKTKDFANSCGSISATFAALEQMLQGQTNYRAYFQSAVSIYCPIQKITISHEEREYGTLSFPATGTEGFGFDPVFIPEGYDQTIATLGLVIKNQISHRAKALRELFKKFIMQNEG